MRDRIAQIAVTRAPDWAAGTANKPSDCIPGGRVIGPGRVRLSDDLPSAVPDAMPDAPPPDAPPDIPADTPAP